MPEGYPWLRHVFADGGYGDDKRKGRLSEIGAWTVQVAKRTDKAKGFEASIASAEAWVIVANIRLSASSPDITMPADISSRTRTSPAV